MNHNNPFGFSFYGKYLEQLYFMHNDIFGKVEVIIFDQNDLHQPTWQLVWSNVNQATKLFQGKNTSFHFPINNCNILRDNFTKSRLIEALQRADQLDIHTVVVHSNQIYGLDQWKTKNIHSQRLQYLECLQDVIDKANTRTVICLENLPPIGNLYDDADPLFLFPTDFETINPKKLRVAWDICHYFNTVFTMNLAQCDTHFSDLLPKQEHCNYLDFIKIIDRIQHWHFSAFDKIANPLTCSTCREGVLPVQSVVEEDRYKNALKIIYEDAVLLDKSIIFEMSETDYRNRTSLFKMYEWVTRTLVESGIDEFDSPK